MTALFVPACGDRLYLTAPWKFTLVFERRNVKFAQSIGLLKADEKVGYSGLFIGEPYRSEYRRAEAELPAGTVLECDRIYIRQYNRGRLEESKDYDSVTWRVQRIKGKEGKGKPSGRFWVKLPDVYTIEYELRPDSLLRNRGLKLAHLIMES